MVRGKDQISISASGYPVFPETSIEEAVPSPGCGFGDFVKDQLAGDAWMHFWALHSVPRIYLFMQVPCCFGYSCSAVYLEIWHCGL